MPKYIIDPQVQGQRQLAAQGLHPAPAGLPPTIGDQYIGQPRNDIVDSTGHPLDSIRGVDDPPNLSALASGGDADSVLGTMLRKGYANALQAELNRFVNPKRYKMITDK